MDVSKQVVRFSGLLVLLSMIGAPIGVTASPAYSEFEFPQLEPGQGRIVFFRQDRSAEGGFQPPIRVNGGVVGQSIPGKFFFVDVHKGTHRLESEFSLSVALAAGETRYVEFLMHTSRASIHPSPIVTMALMVWKVRLLAVPKEQAVPILEGLFFAGKQSP